MKLDTDVIVIGAGPTGLTLANLLALHGVSVTLVEARTELIDYPRAVGIDDEALRTMQAIGLLEDVLPHTIPGHWARVVNGKGKVIVDMAPKSQEFGFARRNGFVQPEVDAVLLRGLDRFPHVDVRFGQRAIALEQDDNAATLTVQDTAGERSLLTAKYVVGCEGGRSFTREWMGVGFPGATMPERGLVIDVANDPLGNPNAIFGGDPRRGYASIGLPHGIRRWEFMLDNSESDELATSDEFVHGLLSAHVLDPSKLEIIRRRVYVLNARVAEDWRKGRVLIAGDAAHLMPVNAGQGWNSGIRDALNLAWKLAAVVQGTSSEVLLDTYTTERRPHVQSMVDLSVNMSKLFNDRNRFKTTVRDVSAAVIDHVPRLRTWVQGMGFKPMPKYEGAVVHNPLPKSKGVIVRPDMRPLAGTLFPQPHVTASEVRNVLLDVVTGAKWRVVVWNNDPSKLVTAETLAQLEQLDAELVQVVPEVQLPWARAHASDGVRVVGDSSGAFKTFFESTPFSAFVVRPDHVIAGESLGEDLDRTLQQVFLKAATTQPREAIITAS